MTRAEGNPPAGTDGLQVLNGSPITVDGDSSTGYRREAPTARSAKPRSLIRSALMGDSWPSASSLGRKLRPEEHRNGA